MTKTNLKNLIREFKKNMYFDNVIIVEKNNNIEIVNKCYIKNYDVEACITYNENFDCCEYINDYESFFVVTQKDIYNVLVNFLN